jgi:hypothetical protein
MDSEDVNSISDSVEAQQIASVVEDTYYNIISARLIPEHKKLLSLTSMSDTSRPTHFRYPDNTKNIQRVDYNISSTATPNFREVLYLEPEEFLNRMNQTGLKVETYNDLVDIFVSTDRAPTYYTSFDDYHIIMDAYDSSVESILASNKTRAFGEIVPAFSQTDSFEPDLYNTQMPLILAEDKSA